METCLGRHFMSINLLHIQIFPGLFNVAFFSFLMSSRKKKDKKNAKNNTIKTAVKHNIEYEYEEDSNGNFEYEQDENRNFIYYVDRKGKPVYKKDKDGNYVYKKDENGNYEYEYEYYYDYVSDSDSESYKSSRTTSNEPHNKSGKPEDKPGSIQTTLSNKKDFKFDKNKQAIFECYKRQNKAVKLVNSSSNAEQINNLLGEIASIIKANSLTSQDKFWKNSHKLK